MKKYICMSFFLILCSQCSAVKNSKDIFLKEFQGTWKTTDRAELWFKTQLVPPATVAKGTIVNVSADGSFTVSGIPFTFVEIEMEGMLAVYRFVHNAKSVFVGIGFGQKDDVLINPSTSTSADLVKPAAQGTIFLIK